MDGFMCERCGRMYTDRRNLRRHIREKHENHRPFTCGTCRRQYARSDQLEKHMQTHIEPAASQSSLSQPVDPALEGVSVGDSPNQTPVVEPQPGTSRTSALSELADHTENPTPADASPTKKRRKTQPGSSSRSKGRRQPGYICRAEACGLRFTTRGELIHHRLEEHVVPRLVTSTWSPPFPWENENGEVEEGLRDCMQRNRGFIFTPHRHDQLSSTFNFPIRHFRLHSDLQEAIRTVRLARTEALKLNICFGLVLQHRETNEFRYFVPGQNAPLLDELAHIDTPGDWDVLAGNLDPIALLDKAKMDRPNTKWQLISVTNVKIVVYYLGVNLGVPNDLPDYIHKSKSVCGLARNRLGQPFGDNLCVFRAVVFLQNIRNGLPGWHKLQTQAKAMSAIWGEGSVHLADLENFEIKLGLKIDIYSMDNQAPHSVFPRYLSRRTEGEKLVFNLHNDHISPVIKSDTYLQKFVCISCRRYFTRLNDLKRHRGKCNQVCRLRFVYSYYRPPPTVFDKLAEVNIDVCAAERFYPWHAEFDAESILSPFRETSECTVWTARHDVISVAVCSNVPGFEEGRCFIDSNPDTLVQLMLDYLEEISAKAYQLALQRWDRVTRLLTDDPEAGECDDEDSELGQYLRDPNFVHRREELWSAFDGYMRQLVVCGFNSANYDWNVLRKPLLNKLHDVYGQPQVIKKHNSYTVVSVPTLKFIDIINFLAPGFSYSQFLKAYGVQEKKGYMPYEWLDNAEKLDSTTFPPYEAFFSSVRGGVNLLDEGQGEAVGRERHAELVDTFQQSMSTFRDYLRAYNLSDTVPFTKAVDNMLGFYVDLGIDLFKVAISVPGVARKLLYREVEKAGVCFSSIHPNDEDLFRTIKRNLSGGPSIIFTRKHVANETFIRDQEGVLCGTILGYDANGLYVWCLGQRMMIGDYVRRRAPTFAPEVKRRPVAMFDWLDWEAKNRDKTIWHQRNHGEVCVGPYTVDGFGPGDRTVYEYDGCWWHGCDECGIGPTKIREQRAKHTRDRNTWLVDNGYTLIIMKEHTFNRMLKSTPQLLQFVNGRRTPFRQRYPGPVDEAELERGVRSGLFFGMVECDIHVPENLYDHFAEMSPLFVNSTIPFEDVGSTMQEHIRSLGLSEKPRRLLVGGMSAREVLLSSDLLKWYLDHGLKVTTIHQVVEFTPARCFENFVNTITEARRRGDSDPDLKIVADTFKLIGNSSFGSTLLDREKHQNISYKTDIWNTQLAMNDPSFTGLEELGPSFFEVSRRKRRVLLDLPVQIGFQILQLAKMHMLRFYYDFLCVRFDRRRFECIEMDTDSLYFAVGGTHRADTDIDALDEAENNISKLATVLRDICLDQRWLDDELLERCNVDVSHTPDQGMLLPRECCEHHRRFDARTVGLFKLEASGSKMIALCSKTYCLLKDDGGLKTVSKGLRKLALTEAMMVFDSVLIGKQPAGGVNRGFRPRHGTVCTYEQYRACISWLYCKRVVHADSVHTTPLVTVLCPWDRDDFQKLEDNVDDNSDSMI